MKDERDESDTYHLVLDDNNGHHEIHEETYHTEQDQINSCPHVGRCGHETRFDRFHRRPIGLLTGQVGRVLFHHVDMEPTAPMLLTTTCSDGGQITASGTLVARAIVRVRWCMSVTLKLMYACL